MFKDTPRLEDEDDEPDHVVTMTSPVPSVSPPARIWEYRADVVSVSDVVDGAAFATRLNQAAEEGWDLVEIVDAAERKVLVLRRPKQSSREHRRVGFTSRFEP